MPLNEIATIVEISNTPKTMDKYALIKENESENLKILLFYAFNTFNVYGIKHLEFEKSTVTAYNWKKHNEFCNILNMLLTTSVNQKVRTDVKSFLETCNQPQQSIYYSILIKDLRIGVQAKGVNKALGYDLIPQFSVMTCEPYEEQDLNVKKLVQKKYDGYRCLIIKDGMSLNSFSRNGNPIPLPTIFKELSKIEGSFVLDGELVSTTRTGTSGICNSLIKGNKVVDDTPLVFYAFDFLPLAEYKSNKFTETCEQRTLNLEVFILNNKFKKVQVAETIPTSSTEEVLKLYKLWRSQGEEGLIIKDPEAPYETRRSDKWLKLKAINSCTLRIIDKYVHKHGGTLGGFICETLCGTLQVRVGGGFTDEDREVFWGANMNGKCIEVLYNEVQKDEEGNYFLFLPRFKETRIDKNVPDTLQIILKECK